MGDTTTRTVRRRSLVALTVAYLVVGVLWAVAVPPLEKPDEVNHFACVLFVAEERRLPVQAGRAALYVEPEAHQPPLYYTMAAVAQTVGRQLGLPTTDLGQWWPRRNKNYAANARVLSEATFWLHHDMPGQPDAPQSYDLLMARLLNLLLGLLTVLVTYHIGLLVLAGRHWLALASAAIVAFLPQFTFISTSVNNDPMSWVVAAVYVLALLRLVDAPAERINRRYALLGALMGIALLTKLTLVCLLPLVLLARPRSITGRQFLFGLLVWATAACGVSFWWFLRNLSLYGDPLGRQELVNPELYSWNLAPKALTDSYFRGPFWRAAAGSSIGQFGFMHIVLPWQAYRGVNLIAAAAAFGVVLHVIRLAFAAPSAFRREHAVRLAILGLLPLMSLFALIHYNLSFTQPQGRYLLLSLPGVAVLGVLGLDELSTCLSSWMGVRQRQEHVRLGRGAVLALALIAAIVALNVFALFAVVVPVYGPVAWSLVPGN